MDKIMPTLAWELKGNLDNKEVNIPFITNTDLDNYLDMLRFLASKGILLCDLEIIYNNNVVGKIFYKPSEH